MVKGDGRHAGRRPDVEQIIKQCSRLARVREVKAVTSLPHIEREMALIDVDGQDPGTERQEVMSLVEHISSQGG